MKEQAIGYAEDESERELTMQHWPFDDHDETESRDRSVHPAIIFAVCSSS
jgi:hypothetical protein